MNDELTTRLSRQLHDQVDDWHDTPLTLAGVQGRARTIRRRRQALAAGVVAAAVLAVAIPVGVGLGGRTDSTPPPANPSPTRVVDTPAPTPRADGSFALDVLDAPVGEVPASGYLSLDDDLLHTPDGVQELPGDFVHLRRFGDGWVGLRSGEFPQSYGTQLVRLDADLTVTDEVLAAALVVDRAGENAAWVEVEGAEWTLVRATPDGEGTRTDVASDTTLMGFLTDGSVVTSSLATGRNELAVVDPSGRSTPFGQDLLRVLSVSESTGVVAAMTRYRDDLQLEPCSAVLDPANGVQAFETCDHQPRAFSPDGSLVAAFAAYGDSLGSPELAVLDAATGEPLVRWSSGRDRQSPASVQSVVWEDDDTLLAVVTEGNEQTVVRAELDGTIEQVAEPVEVEMSIAYRFPQAIWNVD